MDRFSHLAIYTAIRCLMVGRGELWQRFNNGDNLLFREVDFAARKRPNSSAPLGDRRRRRPALVGRLVLACRRPLEETPLIQDIVTAEGNRCLESE